MDTILNTHSTLSNELADLLVEKSLLDAAVVTTRAETFDRYYLTNEYNVTTIKEMASTATAPFQSEAIKLQGRIDALRVQLHHLDQRLLCIDGVLS